MANGEQADAGDLVEPVPIVEEFASGLAAVEIVGDVTFLVFYVDQVLPPELGSRRARRIVRKIIVPNAARDRMRRMLEAAERAPPIKSPRCDGHH